MLLALSLLANQPAGGETIAPADDSPEARQGAIDALPLDQLNAEMQAQLCDVVSRATIYRRLPTEAVACDPELYLTMVRNPDIVVNIWRLMEATDVTMQLTSPFHYHCDDKAGTTSDIQLVYGTPTLHVFYADSVYEGPLLARPVKARVVLLLRTSYAESETGEAVTTSTMDAFIRIDHVTANLVARTLSPLVGRTADHNFVESFRFLGRVQETAEENGPGMQRLAMRLEEVELATRQKLAAISGRIAAEAQQRETPSPELQPPPPAHANASAEPGATRMQLEPRAIQMRR